MDSIKARNQGLKSAGGFTLIELLVVISVLGVLAGVVVLNVIGFIGAGHDEAKAVEMKQVSTAVGAYMFEGNTISTSMVVGPGELGDLGDYLIGDLQYYWSVDSDGSVHPLLFGSSFNGLDGFTVTGDWTPDGGGGLSSNGGDLLANGGSWNDFTFQTTATFNPTDTFGMYYRSDGDGSDGYFLQFVPGTGFTVSTLTNNTITAIPGGGPFMPPGFVASGSHSISVSVSGGSHTISIDGATFNFSDSTYGSGTVGLQTGAGSNVNFTGFTVSPP